MSVITVRFFGNDCVFRNAAKWRDRGLSAFILGAAICIFLISALLSDIFLWAPILPLALIALGVVGWIMLAAIYGSPAAIMIFFSIVCFLTDAQFRARGAGEITSDWQSALKFLAWLGAGIIGYVHTPSFRTLLLRPACVCWLAYIFIAIISSIYSPVPAYSFGCALALLCLFFFSFALTRQLTEPQILWTMLLTLTIFNVGGWMVFYLLPDLGTSVAWTNNGILLRMCGLAGQATNLGAVCAQALGAAFILWYTRRCGLIVALILGGFAFLTLVKSDARTTEIAALLGILTIVASKSPLLIAGGTLAAISGLAALQVFPGLLNMLGSQFSRSGDPTEIYTLTGRLEIWDFSWSQIKLSPYLGYGYNSSKIVLGNHIGFENGLMVDSAHNMYLQNLLSVGVIGIIPLITLLLYLIYKCFTKQIPIICYTLVIVLISSISDTDSIGTTPTLMTILFFLSSVWPDIKDKN